MAGGGDLSRFEKVTRKFEYLDHTADVQIHSWGEDLSEAFEQAAMGMFNYMTDIDGVCPESHREIEVEGEDLESLLYKFLDEFLFMMSCVPYYIPREVKITEFDEKEFKIKAVGYGEEFDEKRHGGQGTEIKAITYSAMEILTTPGSAQTFVIVDI
ncbi:protein archease-like [Styela clava]